jgi:hypothetical protein
MRVQIIVGFFERVLRIGVFIGLWPLAAFHPFAGLFGATGWLVPGRGGFLGIQPQLGLRLHVRFGLGSALAGLELGLFSQQVRDGWVQLAADGLGRLVRRVLCFRLVFKFGLGFRLWLGFKLGRRFRFGLGCVDRHLLAQLFGQVCVLVGMRLEPGVPAIRTLHVTALFGDYPVRNFILCTAIWAD